MKRIEIDAGRATRRLAAPLTLTACLIVFAPLAARAATGAGLSEAAANCVRIEAERHDAALRNQAAIDRSCPRAGECRRPPFDYEQVKAWCVKVTSPSPIVSGSWNSNHGSVQITQEKPSPIALVGVEGTVRYKNGNRGSFEGVVGWCKPSLRICAAGKDTYPHLFVQYRWQNATGSGDGVMYGVAAESGVPAQLAGAYTHKRSKGADGYWRPQVPTRSGGWNLWR